MKKILVVDDIEAIVRKTKSLLSRSGFTILTATSGQEAIELHRSEKVDLIITDLDMPGMNGDILCSIVRKQPELRNVSTIILCPDREIDIRRCESCGANAHVTKPMDLQVLFQKISELLDVPRRLSMRFLVQVSVEGKFRDRSFFSTSKNISSGGILLETDKALDRNDQLEISFFLGIHQIRQKGEIVRAERTSHNLYHYGVKFIDMDQSSKAWIEEYVGRLLRR